MLRRIKASAVVAVCCAVAGTGLAGCEDGSETASFPFESPSPDKPDAAFTGTKKINVSGRSVNMSCSGDPAKGEPVIVLMPGLGDGLDKMAGIQKTLSKKNRVCAYDRLGEGASDKPDGGQSLSSTGRVLTTVLRRVAGEGPVVLAGHSLGGMIAARYAPDHPEKVKGLVLMDATSPTSVADVTGTIPESATGPAAQVRAQVLAVSAGKNPEKLAFGDGKVRSAGNIPVEVIRHGKQYLAALPGYGPRLERAWTEGQRKWLAVSGRSELSTAEKSEHHIYLDQPDVAVQAVQRVIAQAAGTPGSPVPRPTTGG